LVIGHWSLVVDSGFLISFHYSIHAFTHSCIGFPAFLFLRIHAFTHYSIHALAVGIFYSFAPSVTYYDGLRRIPLLKVLKRCVFKQKDARINIVKVWDLVWQLKLM
jgi:hypothetical protein